MLTSASMSHRKGSVNANGVPVDLKSFRKETAYVMQVSTNPNPMIEAYHYLDICTHAVYYAVCYRVTYAILYAIE